MAFEGARETAVGAVRGCLVFLREDGRPMLKSDEPISQPNAEEVRVRLAQA